MTFKISTLASIVVTAALVSACGTGTELPINRTLSNTTNLSSSTGTGSSSNTTPTPNPSHTPAPTPSVITGSSPPYSFRVGATGYTSTTVTVTAGKVLKVRFTPGVQDEKIAGTGVSPNYSMLGVYITVNGVTGATQMLSNGFRGGGAQTSTVLDFSNGLSCGGNDPTCRKSVTITIDHPNNDYWCLNYGQYCPWTWVYNTHPWHGTLVIQTDDTTAI